MAEVVKMFMAEPAFEVGAGVNAGRGVPLEVDLVAAPWRVGTAKEVVKADFVERRRRGVGRNVAADALVVLVRPDDHRHRIPADEALHAPLEVAVAGETRLSARGNRVDVR